MCRGVYWTHKVKFKKDNCQIIILKPRIYTMDLSRCVGFQDKVFQFCSKTCCEDYKKLHCIVTFCEYCQEEKTLHETVKFSGVKRPFCSEGDQLTSFYLRLICSSDHSCLSFLGIIIYV